jgi:hypothetical protein
MTSWEDVAQEIRINEKKTKKNARGFELLVKPLVEKAIKEQTDAASVRIKR